MARNYLLTYAEQLATDVELLCQNIKAPSNTLFQIRKSSSSVYAIFVKPITDKAKRICSRNLKLPSRNVVNPKDGYNCCSTHR